MDLKLNNNNANIGDESYESIFSSQTCPNNLSKQFRFRLEWPFLINEFVAPQILGTTKLWNSKTKISLFVKTMFCLR
jgi:hypothetical protein